MSREDMDEFKRKAHQARMRTITQAVTLNIPIPQATLLSHLDQAITDEIERFDTVKILKYCFVIQKERVIQLCQLEKARGIQLAVGNKYADVLREIAVSLWKVQAGQATLRSKNPWLPSNAEVSRATSDLVEQERKSDQYSFRMTDERTRDNKCHKVDRVKDATPPRKGEHRRSAKRDNEDS